MNTPIEFPSELASLTPDQLSSILSRYPWFDTARFILQYKTGARDPFLRLRLQMQPRPDIMLDWPQTADFSRNRTLDAIDRFLASEPGRIVPDPTRAVGGDISRESIAEDPELVSEELAEIFARQGFYSKAREIYSQLSLLNPEKSVYFAEIIAGISAKESEA